MDRAITEMAQFRNRSKSEVIREAITQHTEPINANKVLVTLDDETKSILDGYKDSGQTVSRVIRNALIKLLLES